MSIRSITANFIDLLIIPAIMASYYQSVIFAKDLKLSNPYFLLILFLLIHFVTSIIIILENYVQHRQLKLSLGVIGMGPTTVAFITLLAITILPFLKWPFYIFKWIPHFDQWIKPFIMGIFAFLAIYFLKQTLGDSIFNADQETSGFELPNPQ
jgi:hypothetical protein